MTTVRALGFAKKTEHPDVTRFEITRPAPQGNELLINVLYCGICHSDLVLGFDNWGRTKYPCVPGHEVVGRVIATGPSATQYKLGDIVGVGILTDSCGTCEPCIEGWENHCEGPNGATMTCCGYLAPKTTEAAAFDTYGAWAETVICREDFVLKIPEGADLAKVAPLMCAGTDTYGPLKRMNLNSNIKLGIVGFGGPGHVALQMARAMGAGHITVFTTHPEKRDIALRLGADEVIDSTDANAMQKASRTFHQILSTIPVPFDPTPYFGLLRRRCNITIMALLGPYKNVLNNIDLAIAGLTLTGSMIGSVGETREMLAFCAKHDIWPMVEVVDADPSSINKVLDRLQVADVRFRFVIKMKKE